MNKMLENIICIDDINVGFNATTTIKFVNAVEASSKSTAIINMITELKKKRAERTAKFNHDLYCATNIEEIMNYNANLGVKKVK